jgi:hypothetical protein
MEVTVFRRATQWTSEVLLAPSDKLSGSSIGFSIGLAAIFEGVRA